MTNYEYMKTLSKDEMVEFIVGAMSEAFKTEEEAEKKLKEWQALIVENKGFLRKETL